MTALYKWLAGLLLVASALGAAWWRGHAGGFAAGAASVQAKWDAQQLVDARSALQERAKQAADRATYDKAQLEAENATKRYMETADAEHARALDLAVQLRNAAAATLARRDHSVSDAPAAAASSSTASGPGLLLADVLGGLGADGTALAREADARRVAALRCQAGRQVSK